MGHPGAMANVHVWLAACCMPLIRMVHKPDAAGSEQRLLVHPDMLPWATTKSNTRYFTSILCLLLGTYYVRLINTYVK